MNNQFGGPNAWGDYLTALEQVTPVIEAIAVIAVTDYYVTDTYEHYFGSFIAAVCGGVCDGNAGIGMGVCAPRR